LVQPICLSANQFLSGPIGVQIPTDSLGVPLPIDILVGLLVDNLVVLVIGLGLLVVPVLMQILVGSEHHLNTLRISLESLHGIS
jgi:hypothetical protein